MEKENNQIQEMQMIEQTLQNILLQKQVFNMELQEIESSLKELEKNNEDVYKIIGQLMIKKQASEVKEELKNKEKIINLRLNNLEKQEEGLMEKSEKIRKEILGKKKK